MQPSAAAAGSQQQPAGGSGTPGTALTGPPWLDARRVAAGGVVPPGIPARRRLHPRAAALRRCPGRPGRVAPDVAARPEPDRRRLALGCLLFFATAAAVLPVSDAFEFSWRYQLPALVTLPPADALGLACLARSARRRAPGGRAPGGRPRHSRAAGRELQHAHGRLVQAPLHLAQVRVGQPRQFASWRRDRLASLRWVGETPGASSCVSQGSGIWPQVSARR